MSSSETLYAVAGGTGYTDSGVGSASCTINSGSGPGVYYYIDDMLGSSRTIVKDGQTSACYEADFYPFGGERDINVSCVQNYKFTAQERDSETNNDNFGARYFGSRLGRFMSPDPSAISLASLSDPQELNLYSYVRNNPLSNIDPTGLECVWDDGSYDANDDPDSGDPDKCAGLGGTWIGHDVFANSQYYGGDWSADPNDSLGRLVGDIQACSAAVGGSQGASLLVADAFASGFSNDQTAYVLATAQYETAGPPIGAQMTEVGSISYFNQYQGRLGNYNPGDGYLFRGRGYVQLTGKRNYQNWSIELGMPLVQNPGLAATPDVAAQIAVEGLDEGSFTGVSLYDYVNSSGADFVNARRTINGLDHANSIASSAQSYVGALAGCR